MADGQCYPSDDEIKQMMLQKATELFEVCDKEKKVSVILKSLQALTHWGRMTQICVGKLSIIGSDNGLSPGRRQAIIWTNAGILLIGPKEQISVKF